MPHLTLKRFICPAFPLAVPLLLVIMPAQVDTLMNIGTFVIDIVLTYLLKRILPYSIINVSDAIFWIPDSIYDTHLVSQLVYVSLLHSF